MTGPSFTCGIFTLSPIVLVFVTLLLNTESASEQKVVCYFETWAHTRPPPMNYDVDDILDNTCDYLVLLFVQLDEETWNIKLSNGYTPVKSDQLVQAGKSKERSPGMKVLLSVGGWEDGVAKYTRMMSLKSSRAAFVDSVVQFLEEYNLDGVELHWLWPGNGDRGGSIDDRDNFVRLVKELVMEFKPRKWVVTAHVPADQPALDKGYNVVKLNSLLHQIHLHTFDLRGHWSQAAENHSPLFRRPNTDALKFLNVNDALSLWVRRGASRRKLIPTFPLFGRTFTLEGADEKPGAAIHQQGAPGEFTTAPGILAYYEICALIQNQRLTYHFDNGTQTPYATGGHQWVGYDDEHSLRKKAEFVREMGYGGAALFAISLDDFTGVCGEKHHLLKQTRILLQ